MGLPTSATTMFRSSSLWASRAAWNCSRQRRRKAWSVAQVVSSKARRAAAMASAMSAVVPSAVTPSDSSVAGSMLSKRRPRARLDQLAVDQQARLAPYLRSCRAASVMISPPLAGRPWPVPSVRRAVCAFITLPFSSRGSTSTNSSGPRPLVVGQPGGQPGRAAPRRRGRRRDAARPRRGPSGPCARRAARRPPRRPRRRPRPGPSPPRPGRC